MIKMSFDDLKAFNGKTHSGMQVGASHRCQDKKCRRYGEKLVDRGYGYPVCPDTPPKLGEDTL